MLLHLFLDWKYVSKPVGSSNMTCCWTRCSAWLDFVSLLRFFFSFSLWWWPNKTTNDQWRRRVGYWVWWADIVRPSAVSFLCWSTFSPFWSVCLKQICCPWQCPYDISVRSFGVAMPYRCPFYVNHNSMVLCYAWWRVSVLCKFWLFFMSERNHVVAM